MANLSRSEKYRELRNSLQNEIDDNYQSKELSRFERRLNRIDANNFSRSGQYNGSADDYDPTHARRVRSAEGPEFAQPEKETGRIPSFANRRSYANDYNDSYENDFLDQYIREVKQYNVNQGNALSDNTQVNVLRQLREGRNETSVRDRNPYGQERRVKEEMPRQEAPQHDYYQDFYNRRRKDLNATDEIPAVKESPFEDDEPDTMSKEDIMAEVQNLVNGRRTSQQNMGNTFNYSEYDDTDDQDYFDRHNETERDTRQQLLNETTQMRAQLDDYEDNLNEFSDKMKHTDRILNIILIVLIVALGIALAFVVYWVILTR